MFRIFTVCEIYFCYVYLGQRRSYWRESRETRTVMRRNSQNMQRRKIMVNIGSCIGLVVRGTNYLVSTVYQTPLGLMWEYKNLAWIWGGDRKICLRVTVFLVMPNSDPEGQIFPSTPNNHDRFFFLYTFWLLRTSRHLRATFLYVEVSHIESWCKLPTSYSFFIYPTGRIRVCKIKICQHWWKSRKTLSGMQESHVLLADGQVVSRKDLQQIKAGLWHQINCLVEIWIFTNWYRAVNSMQDRFWCKNIP